MATSAKELYEKSLALEERERVTLAALILESLEPWDSDAEDAWKSEIERRLSEMDSGKVEPVPWEAVRARLSKKLDAVGND